MLTSKPKSGLSKTTNKRPATPTGNKKSRTGPTRSNSGSSSPLPSSHVSPKSVDSKPTAAARRPKASTTPDKPIRSLKISELPIQLSAFEEDLKKVKDQLAFAEQEKARAVEELKDAKRLQEETNEKLKEALAAHMRAEGSSEIAKFRADELEQASIEAAQKRKEEWEMELERIEKQHSSDLEELEKVRQELGVNIEAKNNALSKATNATKMADANAEKVEFLSVEVGRLKSLLDSKLESVNNEAAEIIRKLDSEVDVLKNELETAKAMEEKLVVMETLVERLSTEADDAKCAELESCKLVDDWKKKAESLEVQLLKVKQSEQSSFDSLAMLRKQLEDSNALLQVTESEISSLRGKMELLEQQLGQASQSEESSSRRLEEVNASLRDAETETAVFRGKVELLEIEVAEIRKAEVEARKRADEWKKNAEFLEAQLVESEQHEKSALESLASVSNQLEESSTSLQDAEYENSSLRKKLESLEIEVARYEHDLVEAKQLLDIGQAAIDKATASKAESILEEKNQLIRELEMAREEEEKAKKAMDGLASALHEVSTEAREAQERLFTKRIEFEDAHAQIEQLRLVLKNTEENYEVMLDEARYEIVCLKKSIERFETEVNDSKVECNPKELNLVSEIGSENKVEIIEENGEKTVAETLKAKLNDGDNKLQSISQENDELQSQEDASKKEFSELSALLAEATIENPENGVLSSSEKEYDPLPNSKEIPVENMNGSTAENSVMREDSNPKEENTNGHHYLGEEEPVEVEVKMWEGFKAMEKDRNISTEMDNEDGSLDDLDLKMGNGSFDQTNGLTVSPTKQHLKKKKPLFHKFGSLLKKKNNH